MTNKKIILIAAIFILCMILISVIIANSEKAQQDEIEDMIVRAENALDDEWKKQTVTEVFDLVYSDDGGNTVIYYVCITTYYDADSNNQSGLNNDAISAVINPDEADSCRECTVSGLPAAIYKKDGRAYLCWTIIPELSCVIKYDPAAENEADIFRMAESVPVNVTSSVGILGP